MKRGILRDAWGCEDEALGQRFAGKMASGPADRMNNLRRGADIDPAMHLCLTAMCQTHFLTRAIMSFRLPSSIFHSPVLHVTYLIFPFYSNFLYPLQSNALHVFLFFFIYRPKI